MIQVDPLRRGRDAYASRAWADAYEALASADRTEPLEADDLERLAICALLTGRDADHLAALERAHHLHAQRHDPARAARCAFWLGLRLMLRGETGPAGGWLARAQRLVEAAADECVEQGYLLLPVIEQHLRRSDGAAAAALAAGAVAIGERFADADLIACARHLLGRAWIQQRRVDEGLALLDEAMVAVTADELSPLMTGLVYCSVIDSCQQICDVRRAREWTSALAQWCDRQPQLVAFTDACLVHRAEILQLNGAWTEAIAEATRACERPARQGAPHAPAAAFYQQAEVYRLRGELEAAERAYRLASQSGADPQPGLALLRLAQRRPDAAATQIRRVLLETADPLLRAKLLPAFIEIMLANAQLDEARAALEELQRCAESLGAALLRAQAAQAQGAIELAGGEPQAALVPLRAACHAWQHLDVPYEVGRTRMLIGAACRAIGDRDGAELELQAARQLFERLQARPDVARVDSLLQRGSPDGRANLTAREVQVLRSVAAGKTNREIAAELSLSEKTVDRHVSNIFDKLGVSSRAAATASAYENGLI